MQRTFFSQRISTTTLKSRVLDQSVKSDSNSSSSSRSSSSSNDEDTIRNVESQSKNEKVGKVQSACATPFSIELTQNEKQNNPKITPAANMKRIFRQSLLKSRAIRLFALASNNSKKRQPLIGSRLQINDTSFQEEKEHSSQYTLDPQTQFMNDLLKQQIDLRDESHANIKTINHFLKGCYNYPLEETQKPFRDVVPFKMFDESISLFKQSSNIGRQVKLKNILLRNKI